MVPGIVIGISTLIAFVTLFGMVNPMLQSAWNIKIEMGVWTVIAAHVLFNLAVVCFLVRARLTGMDRSLVEASEDLYASPWGTFRQVVLPLLMPSILAGLLLSFTFSFEDFIITFFVAGPNVTLPIYVFSSIRRGVTPEINAVGTVVLMTSLILLFAAQFILQRSIKQTTRSPFKSGGPI
jgi:spermidine/putrescine transport system permease protein